ncbi:RidA family protein [Frigidibacter sp. ROC022]|uniref:RidA family protein n=1 Tax=Frigidibacter sp. ROC022 TaxID=2971796 RepID=UPI00215B30A7|nr:RidA family protein [Frigidibacter sp. ROC022]MCR8726052.1 RidA family protein [Frigidibacter sp. ROC022]
MLKLVDKGAKSNRPFSPGFIAGDMLHISGQASVSRDDGTIIPGTFEEEMRRSIENLEAILKAAGLTLDHVISVRCYLGDSADGARHNEIYAEYFAEPRPVRSTISGVLGTQLKYELDAIAYVPMTRQEAQRVE